MLSQRKGREGGVVSSQAKGEQHSLKKDNGARREEPHRYGLRNQNKKCKIRAQELMWANWGLKKGKLRRKPEDATSNLAEGNKESTKGRQQERGLHPCPGKRVRKVWTTGNMICRWTWGFHRRSGGERAK